MVLPRDLVDVLDYLLPTGDDPPRERAEKEDAGESLQRLEEKSLQRLEEKSHQPIEKNSPQRLEENSHQPIEKNSHHPLTDGSHPPAAVGSYSLGRERTSRPAALPIVTLPIGDRDVVRAAFGWNLAVEIARLGGNATLVAPADPSQASLWPSEGRGPLGAQLELVRASDLGELNRAALDIAVSRTADSADGGIVLVRVPPDWMTRSSGGRALLRWVLLFSSPESQDLREAYALAKWIVGAGHETRVGVTIHGARRIDDAERAFARISSTALQHLRHSLVSYGLLVDDLHIYRAIVAHRPIGLEHPQSRAARALSDVARLLLDDARNFTVV